MSESTDIPRLAADIDTRLEKGFGRRRGTLVKRLRRAGGGVPKWLVRDAVLIGQAVELDSHPKLRKRVDGAAVKAAHDRILRHLDGINLHEKRKDFWLGLAGSMAFNILAIVALVVLVLKWRGLI
ncbi:hypothetical protein LZG00_16535 [Rhodobacteraceae bacterium LMO-12]|nr:hypothetical protein [Rhodobacteraceae bacterium LMO-JJ12]